MKKFLSKLFFIYFLCLLFVNQAYALDLNSKQAILIDYNTGEILFKLNEKDRVFPSSMTKIMTAYLIFEDIEKDNLQLPYKFQVSKEAWQQEGSRMFLDIGSRVSIDDMLKGLIVQSGNDAAYALAEASAPNVNRFVERMNKKAKDLNLQNTKYTKTIGFSEDGHYMSVEDTALLSKKLIEKYYKFYQKYFSMTEYKYNNILQQNRNTLLKTYPGVDGIKTVSFEYNDTINFTNEVGKFKDMEDEKVAVINDYGQDYLNEFLNTIKNQINNVYITQGASIGINLDPLFD